MKKYAIVLLALTLLGGALTVLLFTQDEKLDQDVFASTTKSIRNLQNLDKNLLVLLHASRYASGIESNQLLDLHYEISEEFDNLRYEALFEEIEGSQALSLAVNNFDQSFASREQELEQYIELNGLVTDSISKMGTNSRSIATLDLKNRSQRVLSTLGIVNTEIFALPIGGEITDRARIRASVQNFDRNAFDEHRTLFAEYRTAALTVLANYDEHRQSFQNLLELQTGPLLDAIESEYVDYHNQAIDGSTFFRNALIAYGLCLLAALVFFALQIRRNFLSLEQQVADRTEEIQSAYEDLQESQEQLVQSEKMASLGQMVAGVAHEINTPLGYVSSNMETINTNLGDLSEVVSKIDSLRESVGRKNRDNKEISAGLVALLKTHRDLQTTELLEENNQLLNDGEYGLKEISTLVSSLKDFSRLDRQALEEINVHDCIENSLVIGSNQLRESNITVVKNYSELPTITCVPSKLNQLFLNVISNACFAMKESGGELNIHTSLDSEYIRISFVDQGIGMDEQTLQKVFDPFYTTKEIGDGTGLGMSIAYKIVDSHGGTIQVESELDQGSTFIISLPVTNQ